LNTLSLPIKEQVGTAAQYIEIDAVQTAHRQDTGQYGMNLSSLV
jgi:hypothetical protein